MLWGYWAHRARILICRDISILVFGEIEKLRRSIKPAELLYAGLVGDSVERPRRNWLGDCPVTFLKMRQK